MDSAKQALGWLTKQTGKLTDKLRSYKFYVKATPQRLDSSTMLTLNVYTDRQQQGHVPCFYRWSRLRNGIFSEAQDFRGNTFICEPADVGAIIQVQVTSTDQQHPGTAQLQFGPVQLDSLLKQHIRSAVSTGQSRFSVDVYQGETSKQAIFEITDDLMKISHANSSACLKFQYCLGQPVLDVYPKDPTRLTIIFGQKNEPQTLRFLQQVFSQQFQNELKVNIKFLNRRNKDEFLFVLKGFTAKKELKGTAVISKIQRLQVDQKVLNHLLQIQSLRADLMRLFKINQQQQQQKYVYYEQSLKLQHQIQDIIASYTKLIESKFKTKQEFEQSFIDFQNKKDNALAHKQARIAQQNMKLKQFIRQKVDPNFSIVQLIPQDVNNQSGFNPFNFSKKNQPFAAISTPYEQVLGGLEDQNLLQQKDNQQILKQKIRLQKQLNRSMQKVQVLEQQLQKLNKSGLDWSRGSINALDISTSKIVDQKMLLQKKYSKLKQEYNKLKQIVRNQSQQETPKFKNQNNNFSQVNDINQLKQILSQTEKQRDAWKHKYNQLSQELKRQSQQHTKTKIKLQKKIQSLAGQVDIVRKGGDALNRSQQLSMEMEDYYNQQIQGIKSQNAFLTSQNERLTKMAQKYKIEYKRLKQTDKSLLISP